MITRWTIVVFFIGTTFLGRSQLSSNSIHCRVDITRLDFFTGVEYTKRLQNFYPYVAAECGINRTFFQQRFYPKVMLGSSYDLIKNEKILLGPTIHYAYSALKINRSSSYFHQWHELTGGIRFEAGLKWKFIFSAEYGVFTERYFDQVIKDKKNVCASSYVTSMGLGYAW
jgi:hypothetical protein